MRLFGRVDLYAGCPPETALWREVLDIALEDTKTYSAGGHTIRAATVRYVALSVYMRANQAGIAPVSKRTLAADCRVQPYVISCALIVLRRLHVVRTIRTSRRESSLHQLNVGGLAWPAVRARARAGHKRKNDDPEPAAPTLFSLHKDAPIGAAETVEPTERPPAEWYSWNTTQAGRVVFHEYHQAQRTEKRNVRAEPLVSVQENPIAAAVPEGEKIAEQQQHQNASRNEEREQQFNREAQQQPNRRIEGLISAIAVKSRKIGRRFDETTERRRLDAGETDVEALQRQADELAEEIRNPPPLTDGPDLAQQLYERNGRWPTDTEVRHVRELLRWRTAQ